jgi:dihydroneopterin aldolase/2-amino-4-hydroxy-6-hydroxymethyldihydropteridine diphosphokinase/dihydropteroate synthase
MASTLQDVIRIKNLLLSIVLNSGARWPAKSNQGTLQPILLSVDIFYDIASCGISDNLDFSINYSSISKKLSAAFTEEPSHVRSYQSLEDIVANCVFPVLQGALTGVSVTEIKVKIIQIKAPLHCKEVGLESWSSLRTEEEGWVVSKIRHFVTDFVCPAIIGVNDVERTEEQEVVVNISVETHSTRLDHTSLDFRKLTRSLWKVSCATWTTCLSFLKPHQHSGNWQILLSNIRVCNNLRCSRDFRLAL